MNVLLKNVGMLVRSRYKRLDVVKSLSNGDSVTLIRIFPRFYNPNVVYLIYGIPFLLVVILFEFLELGVFRSFLYVECDRKRFEGILTHELIIMLHIFK